MKLWQRLICFEAEVVQKLPERRCTEFSFHAEKLHTALKSNLGVQIYELKVLD